MPPVTFPALPESSRRSRTPRERVLPVAEIFSVLNAERAGAEVIVTAIVGDDRNPAKRHGLRAPRTRWVELFSLLAAEDPALADKFRETLAIERAPRPRCAGCDNNGCPDCAQSSRPFITKPSGHPL